MGVVGLLGVSECGDEVVTDLHDFLDLPADTPGPARRLSDRISNRADSPFDLRRRRLALADPVNEIFISASVAAALRELRLLDAGLATSVAEAVRGEGGESEKQLAQVMSERRRQGA